MTESKTASAASRERHLRALVCSLGLFLVLGLGVQPGFAQTSNPLDRKVELNIPASMELEDALIELGLQSQLAILINAADVKNLSAKSLKGVYTPRQALTLLLKGSGLSFSEDGDRVSILAEPPSKRLSYESAGTPTASDYQNDDQTATGANSGSKNRLQEVIVTAQRREEAAGTVPISLTALSQQAMDQLNIVKLTDIATIAPGISLSPANPANQDNFEIAIRGIFSGGNSPTTQLYIDETPISIRELSDANSGAPKPYIFDLDHVEVLRGPQGTLFGASAMGGAIRFITPQPSLTESSGTVKTDIGYTLGGAPSYEVGAAYGGPIESGVVGFRVSAWFQWEGGWIDREDPFTGQVVAPNANSAQTFVIRPAFKWVPFDGLSITPALFWQKRHDSGPDSYWVNGLANNENGAPVWGGIRQPLTDEFRIPSLAIKYETDRLVFNSDTSYLDRDLVSRNDFTHWQEFFYSSQSGPSNPAYSNLTPAYQTTPFIPGLNSFVSYDQDMSFTHARQQEFRLSSREGKRFNWVLGAFYRKALTGLEQIIPPDLSPLTEALYGLTSVQALGIPNYVFNGQQLNSYGNVHTTDTSEAGFADIAVEITPRLKMDAGVRIEHVMITNQNAVVAGPLNDTTYNVQTFLDASQNPVTPRASLSYQYSDSHMVYASASRGFRPGGGNNPLAVNNSACQSSLQELGLTSVPKSFGSDTLWSYEIGSKDFWFERRLSLYTSLYYVDWTKIQTGLPLNSCSEFFYTNQGKAISQGFDLQLSAAITQDFSLGVYAGYDKAYYPNADYSAPDAGGALIIGAGDSISGVVPWTASVTTEYRHDLGAIWDGAKSYIRADYRWLDAIPAQDPNVVTYDAIISENRNPAYGVLNMRVGVLHGGLDVSAYVNNLTKEHPVLGFYHDLYGEPLYYASTIRPLTVGLTGWYRF